MDSELAQSTPRDREPRQLPKGRDVESSREVGSPSFGSGFVYRIEHPVFAQVREPMFRSALVGKLHEHRLH